MKTLFAVAGTLTAVLSSHAIADSKTDKTRPSIQRDRGVWILRLHGTREEMAEQHGRFAATRIHESALPFFAGKIERSIENIRLLQGRPSLAKFLKNGINQLIVKPQVKRISPDDLNVLQAFARGAGVKAQLLEKAFVAPDAGQWLTAKIFGKNHLSKYSFPHASLMAHLGDIGTSSLGCSTIVTPETATSALVHGRNLDYEGYGVFDREPMLLDLDSTDPQDLRVIAVTSLGLHTAGLTATNEAGLTLSLHQTMINSVSLKGTPILTVLDHLIRRSRTLSDAEKFLRDASFSGSWKVMISSLHEKESLIADVSATHIDIQRSKKLVVETNHVESPELQAKEFAVSYTYVENSRDRKQGMQKGLKSQSDYSIEQVTDLLAGAGSKTNNVQSVVFVPAQDQVLIAVPRSPYERPVDGVFENFPLFQENNHFHRKSRVTQETAETAKQALATFRQGVQLAVEDGNLEAALLKFRRAIQLDQLNAKYPLVTGLTSFQNQDFDGAISQLTQYLHHPKAKPYSISLAHLVVGQAYDCLGDRPKALDHYHRVNTSFSKDLKKATESGLKSPFTKKKAASVVVDFLLGDLFRF